MFCSIVSHSMATIRKREFLLLLGDIAVFVVSLWATLAIREFFKGAINSTFSSDFMPTREVFMAHLVPFSLLFVVWILVFFIAGLYDRNSLFIKSRLPGRIFRAHIFNLIIASIFFYAVPYFGVAPKVTLFLYLVVSTLIIAFWRLRLFPKVAGKSVTNILIIGNTKEAHYLRELLGKSEGSLMCVSDIIDPDKLSQALSTGSAQTAQAFIQESLKNNPANIIAIDTLSPSVQKIYPALYGLIFSGITFVELQDLYENVTDMVPLNLIDESWFLEHASFEPNIIYNTLKRAMDIVIALPLAIVSLIFYPFVWLAIKLEDAGPIFIYQDRVGENERLVHIVKFRSMRVFGSPDAKGASDAGAWVTQNDNRITRVGAFLRKSRIDELPQLWNILSGDLSLIGPRPELPKLVELYKKEIPHYNVRHLIKPGLSGWAQIHHEKPPHSIEETVEKLSYDLYYIKHRSFWLDLKIALKTVKTLLSRVGV